GRRVWAVGPVPGPRVDVHGSWPPPSGRGRSGDRRVGQPPRSTGAMGALLADARAFSSLRARGDDRRRPTAVRGQPDLRRGDLELPRPGRPVPLHARPPKPAGAATAARKDRGEGGGGSAEESGACRASREDCASRKDHEEEACSREAPLALTTVLAFLRFSRDKRGYELFALVQSEQRGGQSRPRVLYAFRTPPNIKVGRDPFDDETRRSLEQLYPGVGFNWRQITETPIPAADAID